MELNNKEIAIFYRCSLPTAALRRDEIRKFYKVRNKKIGLHHLAKYEGIKELEAFEKIHDSFYPLKEK